MDVSVIIVNYNTFNLTIDCIKSIYQHTSHISFEIIVVDNCSPSRDIEGLGGIFPNVKLILSTSNTGFGAGNNLGSSIATGKYLVFLNSDTLLLNNALREFFLFMEKHPSVGICGGNLYQLGGQPGVSFERRFPGVLSDVDRLLFMLISRIQFGKNLFFNFSNRPLRINGYVSGADLCISRELFSKIGGFDEDFFMYYEETELTHRVVREGKEVYVIPESRIIHLEGGSQGGVNDRKLSWMRTSKTLYFKKTRTKGLNCSNVINRLISFRDLYIQKIKS